MEIKSQKITLVDIEKLVENPKNNNVHPKEQIEKLANIIKAHGFRSPITVSNRSGFIVAGHGRLEAAKILKMKKVPVMYQDFDSEAQEYAHMTADNAIAEWAKIDLAKIGEDILDFGPDFDIGLLGLKNFTLEPLEKLNEKPIELSFEYKIEVDCGSEEEQELLTGELRERGLKVKILI